jgi:hypothetical protein
MAQQCATAKDVSLLSLDSKGVPAFKGTSNKAGDWTLTIAQAPKQEVETPKIAMPQEAKVDDVKSLSVVEATKKEAKNIEEVRPYVSTQYRHPDSDWVMILAYAAKHGIQLRGMADTQKAYLAAYSSATAPTDWRVIKQKTKDEFAIKDWLNSNKAAADDYMAKVGDDLVFSIAVSLGNYDDESKKFPVNLGGTFRVNNGNVNVPGELRNIIGWNAIELNVTNAQDANALFCDEAQARTITESFSPYSRELIAKVTVTPSTSTNGVIQAQIKQIVYTDKEGNTLIAMGASDFERLAQLRIEKAAKEKQANYDAEHARWEQRVNSYVESQVSNVASRKIDSGYLAMLEMGATGGISYLSQS